MNSIKQYFFGLCCSTLILYGCSKEESEPKPCLNCEFAAMLDSVTWDAHIEHCYLFENFLNLGDTTFSFHVYENDPLDGTPDILSFVSIPVLPGHYNIMPGPHTILENKVGASLDVRKYSGQTIDKYSVSDTLVSFINVEFFNLETREWRVNFHLEFVRDTPVWVPPDDPIYPISFSISNGFAEGKVPQ